MEILKGYRVTYNNPLEFIYQQAIEVSLKVHDSSGQSNVLYDMWRFYCSGSEAPIVDNLSFEPKTCVRGYDTRTTKEIFRIYDAGGGLDKDNIKFIVDGIVREVSLKPVIRRV